MQTKINTIFLGKFVKVALALAVMLVAAVFISFQQVARAVEYQLDSAYDKEIWQLNEEINQKRQAILDLQKQTDTYQKILAEKQGKIASLQGQIGSLNTSIAKVSLEMQTLELQMEEVQLRSESTQLKITAQEEEMRRKKQDMAQVIRALDHGQRQNNFLMVIATKGSLSEYVAGVQQLDDLEQALYGDLGQLNTLRLALVSDQTSLEATQHDLDTVREQLAAKSGALSSQKYVKNALISQTKGEEGRYQQLLAQSKKEVAQVNSEIVSLEKVAREKLNRQLNTGDELGAEEDVMWPVPSHYVTAYFHDPDYPFRNVFEHPAIDIKAEQGTPVRAAKSGYVARAKDAGKGYSYIMLVHDGSLSTVYGHVSQILVEEDTFVTKGQIIAYSGGTPGTPGAGNLTTGAHLHFEVRVDGIPVNPLNYLP